MSGGGHSSTEWNYAGYPFDAETSRLMKTDGAFGGTASVKCPYCGHANTVFSGDVYRKCRQCGAPK